MFTLHPQLDADTFLVGRLDLCQVRLMNNCLFPWVILVPERPDIREIHELNSSDLTLLYSEITSISSNLSSLFKADKMNIAALGNVVSQLHVHVIARYHHDPAWPKPVWNAVNGQPYGSVEAQERIQLLKSALEKLR